MINITNGRDTFRVSRGAFEGIYKSQGYSIVKDKKEPQKPNESITEVNDDDDVTEKPISKWTKEECMSYVEEHDIDISKAENAKEIKDIIKDYIAKSEG